MSHYEFVKSRILELASLLAESDYRELVIRSPDNCELDSMPLTAGGCASLINEGLDKPRPTI